MKTPKFVIKNLFQNFVSNSNSLTIFFILFLFLLSSAPFQKCLVQYCALDSQFSAALLDWINSDDFK